MDFEADRDPGATGDPSLADMTRSALSILLKNPKGFFLVVEGKRAYTFALHIATAFPSCSFPVASFVRSQFMQQI